MIKTNKLGVILVVSLWSVLGAVVYGDIQAVRAERRANRVAQLEPKILGEGYRVGQPLQTWRNNRWEELKRTKCKDAQRGGPLKVRRAD
jgi:hypothetical protein